MNKASYIIYLTVFVSILTLVLAFPQIMIEPGNVIEAHNNFENDCQKCHTYFNSSKTEKCQSCHKIENIGLYLTNGNLIDAKDSSKIVFHQYLKIKNCNECHIEHQSYKTKNNEIKFGHEFVDDSIKTNCLECHNKPNDQLHFSVTNNCADCHKNEQWKPSQFLHDKYFTFDRNHPSDCKTCHTKSNFKEYTCTNCHQHSEKVIQKQHLKFQFSELTNCVKCHKSSKFQHELMSESFVNNCVKCHKKPNDNIHSLQAENCNSCHNYKNWEQANIDHSKYFVFDNNHPSDCKNCHNGKDYKTYTCYNCHEHSEQKLLEEHHEEGIYDFKNCVKCHRGSNKNGHENNNKRKKEHDKHENEDKDD
jgi:hypothetical protein